jgi:hypothetical protein
LRINHLPPPKGGESLLVNRGSPAEFPTSAFLPCVELLALQTSPKKKGKQKSLASQKNRKRREREKAVGRKKFFFDDGGSSGM